MTVFLATRNPQPATRNPQPGHRELSGCVEIQLRIVLRFGGMHQRRLSSILRASILRSCAAA